MLAVPRPRGKTWYTSCCMSIFLRVLLGLAIVVVGFLMVWKTDKFQTWVGQIDWAEQKLGSGGTRTFLKLLGAGVAFIGILIATNIISDTIGFFAGFVFRQPPAS